MEPCWHHSKKALMAIKQDSDVFVLAKDSAPNSGNKAYTWFTDQDTMIQYCQLAPAAHFYELYLETVGYPSFMFFDIDREIYPSQPAPDFDLLISSFMAFLERYLKTAHNIDIGLVLGKTVQVCYACTHAKLSAHMRVNVKCENIGIMKQVAADIEQFIYSTDGDRELFTFYKESKTVPGKRTLTTIIDTSIYNTFRCLRIMYSSKWKEGAVALTPYKSSSPLVKDHLILYTAAAQACPVISVVPVLKVAADFTRVKNVTVRPLPVVPQTPSATRVQNMIPLSTIEKVENALKSESKLKELLGCEAIKFKSKGPYKEHLFNFYIDKECEHVCPHVNDVHRSNRSYFQYDHHKSTITYRCFSERCVEAVKTSPIWFSYEESYDALAKIAAHNSVGTLHCKQELITWDETYSAQDMRPYPDVPLLLVRGGMGTGKTKALTQDYLPKYCSGAKTKVLFITYQRHLAKTYARLLKGMRFHNYMDFEHDKEISANCTKLIVCLDSLRKLQEINYDCVVVDEATSVLLHFNSQYMAKKNIEICQRFNLILLRSSRVLFLDACVDNTIVHDVAKYISDLKGDAPYYVKNTFIRPTNRVAMLTSCSTRETRPLLKAAAVQSVIKLLDAGKRVVVSSSTKSFIESLQTLILDRFKGAKNIAVYFNGSQENISPDPSNWGRLDALLYSPSISAGISFEELHFHELVAFIENSFDTPPIDTVLQQLFRVRQLVDGKMNLFVCDSISETIQKQGNYPMTPDQIDKYLDRDVDEINTYFAGDESEHAPTAQVNFRAESRLVITKEDVCYVYDKTSLSYLILRGIILNRNKSLGHFVDILCNTLKDDYKIDCTTAELPTEPDEILAANALLKNMQNLSKKDEIEFSSELLITYDDFLNLENKQKLKVLSDTEITQMWVWKCSIQLWGLPSIQQVDEEFFSNYIIQATAHAKQSACEKFFRALRHRDMLARTVDEQIDWFKIRLSSITEQNNHAVELYKTTIRDNYCKLIQGQRVLERIVPDKKALLTGNLTIQGETLHKAMTDYLNGLSSKEYQDLLDAFSKMGAYANKEAVIKSERNVTYLVKRVLACAFDIKVESVKVAGKAHSNLTEKHLNSKYARLLEKYQPASLLCQLSPDTMVFQDDEPLTDQEMIEDAVSEKYWGPGVYDLDGYVSENTKNTVNAYVKQLTDAERLDFRAQVIAGRGWGRELIKLANKFRSEHQSANVTSQ
jgi:hypothetical protein